MLEKVKYSHIFHTILEYILSKIRLVQSDIQELLRFRTGPSVFPRSKYVNIFVFPMIFIFRLAQKCLGRCHENSKNEKQTFYSNIPDLGLFEDVGVCPLSPAAEGGL